MIGHPATAQLTEADLPLHAHCYCGGTTIEATTLPTSVSYCHCDDCRRVTGAPMAVLAGFKASDVAWHGRTAPSSGTPEGVTRTFCRDCGTPVAFEGHYVPDQKYIHLALFDAADRMQPVLHSYESCRFPWLTIADKLERFETSSRTALNAAATRES